MFNCEFCIKVTTKLDKIKEFHLDMLQIIMPNFVMKKYVDTTICKECDILLTNLFKFKSTCLEFEDTIYNYKKGTQPINLENILGLPDSNGRVCRTCFDIIEQDLFVELKTNVMKQHREMCLSEMDFSLTKAPVLCLTCVESLEKYFNFLKYIPNKEKLVKEQQICGTKSAKTVPEEIKEIVCIDIEDETDQLEEPPICRIVSSETVAENSVHQSVSEAVETNIEQLERKSSNQDCQNKSKVKKISRSENLKEEKIKNVDILPVEKIKNDEILIEEHNVEKEYEAILQEYSSNEDSATTENTEPDLNNSINKDFKTNLKLAVSTETGGQNINSFIDDESSKNQAKLENEATKSKTVVETNQGITGKVGESNVIEPDETSNDLDDDNFDNDIEEIFSNDEIVLSDTENVAETSKTSENNNEKDSAQCHPKQSGNSTGQQMGNQILGQLIILSPINNNNQSAISKSRDEIAQLEVNGVTEQKSERPKRARRRGRRVTSSGSAISDDNSDPDFIPESVEKVIESDMDEEEYSNEDMDEEEYFNEDMDEEKYSNERKNPKRKAVNKYFYCQFCSHREQLSACLDDHMKVCPKRPITQALTIVERSLFSEITHLRQQVERLENMHVAKKLKPDTPPSSNSLLRALLTDSDTDTSVDSETDSLLKAVTISDMSIKLPKNRMSQKFTNVDQNAIIKSLMKKPKLQDSTQTLLKKLLMSKQSLHNKKSKKSTKKDGNSTVTINIDTPGFVPPRNQLSISSTLPVLAPISPNPAPASCSRNPVINGSSQPTSNQFALNQYPVLQQYKSGPSAAGANVPQGVSGFLLFRDNNCVQYIPATAFQNLAPNAVMNNMRFPLAPSSNPANSTVQNSAPNAASNNVRCLNFSSAPPNNPFQNSAPNAALNNFRCPKLSSVPPKKTDRTLPCNKILSNFLRRSPAVPETTPKRKTLPRTCKSIIVELSSDEEEKEKTVEPVSQVEEVIIPQQAVFTDDGPFSTENSAQPTADPLDPLSIDDDVARPVQTFVAKQKESPKTKINISSVVIVSPNDSRNAVKTSFTGLTKVQDKTTVEEKDSDINSIINELEDVLGSLDNKMSDKEEETQKNSEEVTVSLDPTKTSDKAEKRQEDLEEIAASEDPTTISDTTETDQELNLEAGANAHEDESDGDGVMPDTGTDPINSDLDSGDVTEDVEMPQTTDKSKNADINDANASQAMEVSKSNDPIPETVNTIAGSLIVEKVNEYLETINSDEEAPSKIEETPSIAEETPSNAEETPSIAEETPARAEEMPSRAEETPSRAEETPSRAEETPSRAEETPSRAEETVSRSTLDVTIVSDDETPVAPSSTNTLKVSSNSTLKELITKALKHPQARRQDPGQKKPKSDFVLNNHKLEPRQLAIFKCDWCPFNTRYFELIDIHVLSHYDHFKKEQNYSCKDCAVSFFQKILLQKHMQAHHGKFGYKLCFWCVNCATSFANLTEFRNHDKTCQRKNISVKLFKSNHVIYCMLCSYETTFMDKARKHSQTCVCRQTKIVEIVEID